MRSYSRKEHYRQLHSKPVGSGLERGDGVEQRCSDSSVIEHPNTSLNVADSIPVRVTVVLKLTSHLTLLLVLCDLSRRVFK